ncbi:MAG: Uma2 family endonuclease [Symploca sp. SIO2E6]|nr:Uma2 family endonuclease [Symploca sp. SIO2E6]
METPTISLPPRLELKVDLTDEQFWQLCHNNDDLRFETTATGELIIMSPTGGSTSERNSDLNFQLRAWNRQTNPGKVFDSNGGFELPNGAKRAPDSSWVKRSRWNALTAEEQDGFVPLCPDFVVELMSPSDTLAQTRKKMAEYIANGAKLGWLINRKKRQVEIYRPQQEVEILDNPQTVSGENILPGFVLDLATIW